MCRKCIKSDISDTFQTVFQIKHWQFSDTFIKTDTFLMHFQIFSERVLTDICIWQFSDRYWPHFRLCSDCFFVTDSFLTEFWQISNSFLELLGPTLNLSTEVFIFQGRNQEIPKPNYSKTSQKMGTILRSQQEMFWDCLKFIWLD